MSSDLKPENVREINRQAFWEGKILAWEKNRYDRDLTKGGILEGFASRASGSLRFRAEIAFWLLRSHVAGKRVVELGCGTGRMAAPLIGAGASEYVGFDVAESAVEEATRKVSEDRLVDRAKFFQSDVANLPALQADIVFSLGLLDWLTRKDIDRLFQASGSAAFLHSISEKRNSPMQWLHRTYVHLAYGHRTQGYVPKYFSATEILDIAARHNDAPARVLRDRRLSFGAILTSLPPGAGGG